MLQGTGKWTGTQYQLPGNLGSIAGTRLGEEHFSLSAGLLHANPIKFPGASEGFPHAIFKTDKNQACPIVRSVVTNLGFAQARPN